MRSSTTSQNPGEHNRDLRCRMRTSNEMAYTALHSGWTVRAVNGPVPAALSGLAVGRTQNQHRSYRFDIGGAVLLGANTIAVEFAAPVPTALARSVEHGPR